MTHKWKVDSFPLKTIPFIATMNERMGIYEVHNLTTLYINKSNAEEVQINVRFKIKDIPDDYAPNILTSDERLNESWDVKSTSFDSA